MTSSASEASEVKREETGGELLSPPATPNCKKTKHCDSGFRSAWPDEFSWLHYLLNDQESPFMYCALCSTKHSKSSKRWCRSVYRADSFIIRNPGATAVPFCRISRTDSSSTRSAGVSTVEGSSWLILMKTSFILMKHPVRILSWGETLYMYSTIKPEHKRYLLT